MKKTLIWIGIIAVIVIWGISAYNGLVNKDEAVTAAWGQVENAYKRRADLIPQLVATAMPSMRAALSRLSLTPVPLPPR